MFKGRVTDSEPELTHEEEVLAKKLKGIAQNGQSWQVLVMINKAKRYMGSFKSKEAAARKYDIIHIQQQGAKASPNFSYTSLEVYRILQAPPLI